MTMAPAYLLLWKMPCKWSLLCVGGNISYTLDVSEQIEFCAQLYYNCKAAGQEPKLLNDEQISSVLEAFQTYRQK